MVAPAVEFVGPWMQLALTEVTEQLATPVGRANLVPGGPPAWDDCCDGQAWVRLIMIVPTGDPANAGRAFGPCGPLTWTATLGVGVIRCSPSLDDAGNAPAPALLTANALLTMQDLADIKQALQCEFGPQTSKLTFIRWDPLGPEGGCAGGEWQVRLVITNCECP